MNHTKGGNRRRERAEGKCDRLLHLLILMQGGPPRGADDLALVLGVSRRSFFRYLQTLDRCGVPFFHDESARGYRIREDFFMRPLSLSIDEARALADVCAHNVNRSPSLALAWSKIIASLPTATRQALGIHGSDNVVSPYKEKQQKFDSRHESVT